MDIECIKYLRKLSQKMPRIKSYLDCTGIIGQIAVDLSKK